LDTVEAPAAEAVSGWLDALPLLARDPGLAKDDAEELQADVLRSLSTLLFGVTPYDVPTYAIVVVLVAPSRSRSRWVHLPLCDDDARSTSSAVEGVHMQRTRFVSRRQFIAGTVAVTAAGPFLATSVEAQDQRSAPAAIARKVKLGVVGLGGRGHWIAGLFAKHGGYDMHAVAD
jgi:hypothetical protein